ncbi:MAG: hypothetical protein ABI945_08975 [Nitrospirales bacterium]
MDLQSITETPDGFQFHVEAEGVSQGGVPNLGFATYNGTIGFDTNADGVTATGITDPHSLTVSG